MTSDLERSAQLSEKAVRQDQRDSARRSREIEREVRQREKLDQMAQAKLEVAEHNSKVDLLLSLHRKATQIVDWWALATSLSHALPHRPRISELAARLEAILPTSNVPPRPGSALPDAIAQDALLFEAALKSHEQLELRRQAVSRLADRILAYDVGAYTEALERFSSLAELGELGIGMGLIMHGSNGIECVLSVGGYQVIPAEGKVLSSGGRLSVKAIPRQQLHEMYQDYICGAVLRVVRECLAVLPIARILVSARVPITDTERFVLSVAVERGDLAPLDLNSADASEALAALKHRGDFKASRRAGAFQAIEPFVFSEVFAVQSMAVDFATRKQQFAAIREKVHMDRERVEAFLP
jgi:hypothetical protein